MSKITCATCANEDKKYCTVKKVSVAINKRRRCSEYVLETSKVKEKQIIKSVKMGYKEREALRQEYKKVLREARKQESLSRSTNPSHPLTGDLSRFKSTVGD